MTDITGTPTSEQWSSIYRELGLWPDDTYYVDTPGRLRGLILAAAVAGALPAGTTLVDDDDHPDDGGRIRLPLDADDQHGEALLSDYLPHAAFTYQCCDDPDCREHQMAIDSLTTALTFALTTVEKLQHRYTRRTVAQISALQSERVRAALARWRSQRTNIDKAETVAAGDNLAEAADALVANAPAWPAHFPASGKEDHRGL